MLAGLRTPADFDNSCYQDLYTDPSGQVFQDAHLSSRNPPGKDQITYFLGYAMRMLTRRSSYSDLSR